MRLSQQELEKKVFEKFVKNTYLIVVRIQSCYPPEPDILCEHKYGQLYFELTDNTSSEIQESVHTKVDEIRERAYWVNLFPDEYKQKFTKYYGLNSIGCELIIYFGIHPVAEFGIHFNTKLQTNIEWIQQHIQQSQFEKVWIYDYHQDRILACVRRNI